MLLIVFCPFTVIKNLKLLFQSSNYQIIDEGILEEQSSMISELDETNKRKFLAKLISNNSEKKIFLKKDFKDTLFIDLLIDEKVDFELLMFYQEQAHYVADLLKNNEDIIEGIKYWENTVDHIINLKTKYISVSSVIDFSDFSKSPLSINNLLPEKYNISVINNELDNLNNFIENSYIEGAKRIINNNYLIGDLNEKINIWKAVLNDDQSLCIKKNIRILKKLLQNAYIANNNIKSDLDNLKASTAKLNSEKDTEIKRIKDIILQRDENIKILQSKTAKLANMETRLQENVKLLEATRSELQNTKTNSQKRTEEKNIQVKNLQDNLNQKLHILSQKEKEISDRNQALQTVKNELENLKASNTKQLSDKDAEIKRVKDIILQKDENIKNLQDKATKLAETENRLQENIKLLEATRNEFQSTKSNSQKQIEEQELTIIKLEEKITESQEKNNTIIADLKIDLKNKILYILDINSKLKKISLENKKLEHKLNSSV